MGTKKTGFFWAYDRTAMGRSSCLKSWREFFMIRGDNRCLKYCRSPFESFSSDSQNLINLLDCILMMRIGCLIRFRWWGVLSSVPSELWRTPWPDGFGVFKWCCRIVRKVVIIGSSLLLGDSCSSANYAVLDVLQVNNNSYWKSGRDFL